MSSRTRREMWAATAIPVTVMIIAATVMIVAVSVETLLRCFVAFFINPEEADCWVFLTEATEQVVVAALSWRVLTISTVGMLVVKKNNVTFITFDFLKSIFFVRVSILTMLRCSIRTYHIELSRRRSST